MPEYRDWYVAQLQAFYQALEEAQILVRVHPDEASYEHLRTIEQGLAKRRADKEMYDEYNSMELERLVSGDPLYPHSIKAWYEAELREQDDD